MDKRLHSILQKGIEDLTLEDGLYVKSRVEEIGELAKIYGVEFFVQEMKLIKAHAEKVIAEDLELRNPRPKLTLVRGMGTAAGKRLVEKDEE